MKNQKTPGPWVRLAHDMYRNPKVLALVHRRHHKAVAVWACGLAWCGDQRQDGFIPSFAIAQIHGTPADASHLCEVGLWRAVDGGWIINDWPEWQDTNETRQARTARMTALANIRHRGHTAGKNVTDMDARRNA